MCKGVIWAENPRAYGASCSLQLILGWVLGRKGTMSLAPQESAASLIPLPYATRLRELYKKQVGGEKKIKTETPGKSGGYKKQLGGGKGRRREEGREESPRDTTKEPHAAPTLHKASSHGSSAGPRALGRGWGCEEHQSGTQKMRRALNWGLGRCHGCQSETQGGQRVPNWGSGSAKGIKAELGGAKSVKDR